jgi:hypothetical protein
MEFRGKCLHKHTHKEGSRATTNATTTASVLQDIRLTLGEAEATRRTDIVAAARVQTRLQCQALVAHRNARYQAILLARASRGGGGQDLTAEPDSKATAFPKMLPPEQLSDVYDDAEEHLFLADPEPEASAQEEDAASTSASRTAETPLPQETSKVTATTSTTTTTTTPTESPFWTTSGNAAMGGSEEKAKKPSFRDWLNKLELDQTSPASPKKKKEPATTTGDDGTDDDDVVFVPAPARGTKKLEAGDDSFLPACLP